MANANICDIFCGAQKITANNCGIFCEAQKIPLKISQNKPIKTYGSNVLPTPNDEYSLLDLYMGFFDYSYSTWKIYYSTEW